MNIDTRPIGLTFCAMKGNFPRKISKLMKRKKIEHSFDQISVLIIIRYWDDITITQQEIAQVMGKDKSVVLRYIDVLEKDGLVYRSQDSEDRRKNIIQLTDRGIEYTDRYLEVETRLSKLMMHGFSKNEIESFYKVFQSITDKLESI